MRVHTRAHEAFIAKPQVLRALSERLKLASNMATFCSRSTPKLHQKRSQKAEIQNFLGGPAPRPPPPPPAGTLYYAPRCMHLSKATVDQPDHFKSDGYGPALDICMQ